jgi:hypothetical protein
MAEIRKVTMAEVERREAGGVATSKIGKVSAEEEAVIE